VGLRRLRLRRLGLGRLGLRGLRLRRLRLRRLGLRRLRLNALGRGLGVGPVGEHGHHQRNGGTDDEQTQENRYQGKVSLRGRQGVHLLLSAQARAYSICGLSSAPRRESLLTGFRR
jgi:hypothetical protein